MLLRTASVLLQIAKVSVDGRAIRTIFDMVQHVANSSVKRGLIKCILISFHFILKFFKEGTL